MLKSLYKKILVKLGLSGEELKKLFSVLDVEHICAGSFATDKKMCPNTTAISIKLNSDLRGKNNNAVRALLKEIGISNAQLTLFYILYDIPV